MTRWTTTTTTMTKTGGQVSSRRGLPGGAVNTVVQLRFEEHYMEEEGQVAEIRFSAADHTQVVCLSMDAARDLAYALVDKFLFHV